jgi:hypothetical protein
MNENPWDVWYEKGKAAHAKSPNRDVHEDYAAEGGTKSKTDGYTLSWDRFYTGWREAEIGRIKALYPVDAFLEELEQLCVRYGATLNSGCGCCEAGGTFWNKKHGDLYKFQFSHPKMEETNLK